RDVFASQILDATDAVAGFDWTLADIGERHRRFSAVMKAEVQALAEREMPSRALHAARRRPAARRAPANDTNPPSAAGSITQRNRTGMRP
ncbi:hypothetical protein, partial [Mesorhizobium silamurunense]